MDSFLADRSPTHMYRTAPLAGLWSHAKGAFYHDGRFATFEDVFDHYNGVLRLGLSESEKAALVEYLKSLGHAWNLRAIQDHACSVEPLNLPRLMTLAEASFGFPISLNVWQSGSCPETGFAEIALRATLNRATLPRKGLLGSKEN